MRPRYGKVGRYGSIAAVERFIRSFEDGCTRRIHVPLRLAEAREEFGLRVESHNRHRPSRALSGRTPNEARFDRRPANEEPRLEPRRNWPRESLCASPWAPVNGRRGARVGIGITRLGGRKHLPVIRLKSSA